MRRRAKSSLLREILAAAHNALQAINKAIEPAGAGLLLIGSRGIPKPMLESFIVSEER
jgi:hypothetical protein